MFIKSPLHIVSSMLQHQTIGFVLSLRDKYLHLHSTIVQWFQSQQWHHHNRSLIIYQLLVWQNLNDRISRPLQLIIFSFALLPIVTNSGLNNIWEHHDVRYNRITAAMVLRDMKSKLRLYISRIVSQNNVDEPYCLLCNLILSWIGYVHEQIKQCFTHPLTDSLHRWYHDTNTELHRYQSGHRNFEILHACKLMFTLINNLQINDHTHQLITTNPAINEVNLIHLCYVCIKGLKFKAFRNSYTQLEFLLMEEVKLNILINGRSEVEYERT